MLGKSTTYDAFAIFFETGVDDGKKIPMLRNFRNEAFA
jgi:hypothetical protein